MSTDKATYEDADDLVLFNISIDIENGERIPIQNITLYINDTLKQCTFLPDGTLLSGCDNIEIVSNYIESTSYDYGNLYGYGYGYGTGDYEYNATNYGYGYGYGVVNGYTGYSGEITFLISWNITADSAPNGDYTAELEVLASENGNTFTYATETVASFGINKTGEEENNAPEFSSMQNQQATEDQLFTYTILATDEDNDTLTYSLVSAPSGMTINATSGLISWTPTNTQANTNNGVYNIIPSVTDGQAADTGNFSVTAQAVNDAPTISGVPDINGTEDIAFTLNITPYVDDIDNTNTLLTISANSSYATISSQTITFTYPNGVTSESIKITVGDGQLSASDVITATITAANDAPSTPIINIYPKSPAAGGTLMCNITTPSTDIDSNEINYTYTWFLEGTENQTATTTATSNALTSDISGSQVWSCNVTATDGIATTDEVSDSVTVGNTAPTAPTVDLTPNVAYTVTNLTCSITANSTDEDDDVLTYSYKWYKKASGQSQFYLQPAFTTSTLASTNTLKGDTWKCEVKAYDTKAYGPASSDTLTILNSRPTISNPTPAGTTTTVAEGASRIFTITPADADVDTLTTTWYKGTTVVGTGSSYTYTANYLSAGVYTIKATVSDGTLTRDRTWTLTVTDTNRNPIISTIGAQSCTERQACTIQVDATDQDSDNTITFYDNATQFTIGSSTGLISFTAPNVAANTAYSIRITAVDNKGGYDTEIFALTILNDNRAPVLAPIGSITAIENQTYTRQLSATDADGDALTYSDNATLFNITASGLISFSPSSAVNESVMITVSDGSLTDTEAITVYALNTNDAPTIDAYFPASATPSINELQPQTFNVTASDEETTPNIRWYKNGVLVNQTSEYVFTTTYTSAGTYTIEALVDDGLENDTQSWTLTVNNVNRAPVINAIATQQATEDQLFTYTVSASDPDGNTLVYSDNTSLFAIGVLTGTISFTPTQANVGVHSIRVSVADGTTRKNTTFTLNITNVNDVPVLTTIGALTAVENTAFTYTASASDDDSDVLTYSDNTDLFDINSASGAISFTPTLAQSGTYPIRISASDGNGGLDYEDITLTILNTNQAPNITSHTPNSTAVSILEDSSATFNVTATDPDGSTPGIKWYQNGVLVKTGLSYTFTGNFTEEGTNAGDYNISAVATDGLLSATNLWTLEVNRTRDSDADLVPDYIDNCKLVYNPGQTDLDNTTTEGLLCENNVDGDNVLDEEDFVEGGADHIDSNLGELSLEIDNSTDLNRVINETKPVVLKTTSYNTDTGVATEREIISFNFSFTNETKLDLGNVTLRTQAEGSNTGSIIIAGIDLDGQGETKTVYIDDLDNTKNSVCIKDAEIASITEIRGTCDAAGEFKLPCTASGHSRTVSGQTYTCTDLGTTYKIEGLTHSGVRQEACSASWSCSSWNDCSGGVQTCTGGWVDANSCGGTYTGSNTRTCNSGSYDGQPAEPTDTPKSSLWSIVLSGESKTLFGGAGMYVEAVEFMLNTQRESVGLSVKEYQYTTPSVTYSISIPYKYYEITASNFVNADVQSAEITFKVENSWLTSQGLTINDIAMYRYTTGWSELDTSMTSQDNTFTYYKAITPGFSTFVIAKKGGEFVLPPTKPEPTTPPTTTPPTTTPPTTPSIGADKGTDDGTTLIDEEALDKKKGTLLWSVIAIIIILAVLGVWVFGKGGSAELHMKKAEEHHRNALRHKREALGHESRGDNNAARESLRKAADQENKVTGHRRKASHLLLSKK